MITFSLPNNQAKLVLSIANKAVLFLLKLAEFTQDEAKITKFLEK